MDPHSAGQSLVMSEWR